MIKKLTDNKSFLEDSGEEANSLLDSETFSNRVLLFYLPSGSSSYIYFY